MKKVKMAFFKMLYTTKFGGVFLAVYDLYLGIRIIKNILYFRNKCTGNKYFIKKYCCHVAEMKEHFVNWVKTGEYFKK